MQDEESFLKEEVQRLGPWMYKFKLTEKISTTLLVEELSEIHETREKMIFSKLDEIFDKSWNNLNCLDVACNEGYFSFELCKRGVNRVLGFDARSTNIKKANFLKNYFGFKNLEFFIDDINSIDHTKLEKFDVVFLLGLLYHVENPMMILRKIRNLTKTLCIIDTQITRFNEKITMGWGLKDQTEETFDSIGLVEEKTFEHSITGSVTGLSFVPNKSALLKMLKYAGFNEVEILPPIPNSHEQYVNSDRVILFAK